MTSNKVISSVSGLIFSRIFNFSRLRKIYSLIALFVVLFACFSLHKFKLNYGIDFTGGLVINIKKNLDQTNVQISKISKSILNIENLSNFENSIVDEPEFIVLKIKENNDFEITQEIKEKIVNTITADGAQIVKIDLIGRSISEKFIKNVVFCILFAFIAVFIYVFFTFNLKFAIAGVLSLVVNIFFVLSFILVTNMELTLVIVTAILTIIGYSINDTIVIFDRIRESVNLRFHDLGSSEILDIKNNQKIKAISQESSINLIIESLKRVITRSILTSLITLIASIGIFFIPNIDIQNFTKVIILGIFFGTICSLFFATSFITNGKPGLESFIKKKEKNHTEFNN